MTTWEEWRAQLARTLCSMADGEFLNTAGPSTTRQRSPSRFLRRTRKPEVVYGPCVTVAVSASHFVLDGFAVGGEPVLPYLDEAQRALLADAGWLLPGDPGYPPGGGTAALWIELPTAEFERAAWLIMRTYQVFGSADPTELETERGSFDG